MFIIWCFEFKLNSVLIAFDVFNPFTALLTTGVAEILFVITQKLYAKNKLGVDLRIVSNNKKYFILGLLFIPISIIIRSLNLSFIVNLLLIVVCCSSFYIGLLYFTKDENLFLILNKFKNKLKR